MRGRRRGARSQKKNECDKVTAAGDIIVATRRRSKRERETKNRHNGVNTNFSWLSSRQWLATHDDDEKVLHDKPIDDERMFVRVRSKGVSDDFHELPTRVRPRSRDGGGKIGEAGGSNDKRWQGGRGRAKEISGDSKESRSDRAKAEREKTSKGRPSASSRYGAAPPNKRAQIGPPAEQERAGASREEEKVIRKKKKKRGPRKEQGREGSKTAVWSLQLRISLRVLLERPGTRRRR